MIQRRLVKRDLPIKVGGTGYIYFTGPVMNLPDCWCYDSASRIVAKLGHRLLFLRSNWEPVVMANKACDFNRDEYWKEIEMTRYVYSDELEVYNWILSKDKDIIYSDADIQKFEEDQNAYCRFLKNKEILNEKEEELKIEKEKKINKIKNFLFLFLVFILNSSVFYSSYFLTWKIKEYFGYINE